MDKEKLLLSLNDRNDFLKNYMKDNLPKLFYRTAFSKKISKAEYIHQYKMSSKYKKEIIDYWAPYEKINLLWHKAFSAISGIQDVRYIPEDIFYKKIEPALNRFNLAPAYVDKNMSDKLFTDFKMPKTLIRNINSSYYDNNYKRFSFKDAVRFIQHYSTEHKFVLKPSLDSGAGKNVKVLDYRGKNIFGIKKDVEKLFAAYEKDFIVQEFLYQHNFFHQMHRDSLNTIRIISLRLNGNIHILSRVVRMGNDGSFTDNAESGCITCGFDEEGKLQPYATNHWTYEIYEEHPYSHFTFENKVLPRAKECIELVKRAHEKLFYFDLVSWDIAIDRLSKPHLIEIGVNIQDINYHQRTNGPLFGNLTEEVLNKVYHL